MSGYAITPLLTDVYTVLRQLILTVTGLPAGAVIRGLPNRTAMPLPVPGFVMMQAERQKRLRTNVETWDTTNPAPTVISSEQGIELRVQIDCYGSSAGDWAAALSTVLRSDAGCVALAPSCQPLYTSDPILGPLDDSEEQYEQRWTFEAVLQYNPITSIPMQFADQASVTLVNVDKAYPP